MSNNDRAERRAAIETIRCYHDAQLRLLLEHVRDALEQMDAGALDGFEVDELIHRYKRSTRELWKFCGQTGSAMLRAALTLDYSRDHGEEPMDRRDAGETRRRA